MPRPAQLESISAQFRRAGFEIVGQSPARGRFVKNSKHFHVVLQRGRPPAHRAGQLVQDALLLLQRARLGDGQLIAQLHQHLRLDEQRLPAIARVVHDPRLHRS